MNKRVKFEVTLNEDVYEMLVSMGGNHKNNFIGKLIVDKFNEGEVESDEDFLKAEYLEDIICNDYNLGKEEFKEWQRRNDMNGSR